jgi:hypothetical protein
MSDPQSPARATSVGPAPAVLIAGAASTALALAGVWALAHYADENVMGWYADYVLPVGAILVGLVASCGFALGSYTFGARITGRLLFLMLSVLVAGYWAAQWLEFRQIFPGGAVRADGAEVGFFAFFDLATRSIAFSDRNRTGSPLGALGYLVRVADLVGFTVGGLLVPFGLRKLPYCAHCGVYMRQKVVALLPADLPRKRISRKDAAALAAHEAARQQVQAQAAAALARLYEVACAGDGAGFSAVVAEVGPPSARRATTRLPARWQVRAVHCPRCGAGELRTLVLTGQGRQTRSRSLSTQTLERQVASRILAARGR